MSQIQLNGSVNGSEIKGHIGAINGHSAGRKTRDARGRFQRIEAVRADARPVASADSPKRPDADGWRSVIGKVWRAPERAWLSDLTRDQLIVVAFLGLGAFQMGWAFARGLLG